MTRMKTGGEEMHFVWSEGKKTGGMPGRPKMTVVM